MNAVTYGNGIAETWAYDNSYRPTSITDTLSSANVQALTYAYDNTNNVKSIADAVNAANSQMLTYDPTNRLITATSGTGGYGVLAGLTTRSETDSRRWGFDNRHLRLCKRHQSACLIYHYQVIGAVAAGSGFQAKEQRWSGTLGARIPGGMGRNGSSQPPDSGRKVSTMLADLLGWPFLLAGLAGMVRFRKRLLDNKFFAVLFLVAIVIGVGSLLNGCGAGSSGTIKTTAQAATPTFHQGQNVCVGADRDNIRLYSRSLDLLHHRREFADH